MLPPEMDLLCPKWGSRRELTYMKDLFAYTLLPLKVKLRVDINQSN